MDDPIIPPITPALPPPEEGPTYPLDPNPPREPRPR